MRKRFEVISKWPNPDEVEQRAGDCSSRDGFATVSLR
jgi:hypothetical protein